MCVFRTFPSRGMFRWSRGHPPPPLTAPTPTLIFPTMCNQPTPDQRQIIVPASRKEWLALRTKDGTSTDTAALFGCSPYLTLFELWHRKKLGLNVELKATKRMERGNAREAAIAADIAADSGWTIRPMKEYVRLADSRIAASFDFQITDGFTHPLSAGCTHDADGTIFEIKRVNFRQYKQGWLIEDGVAIEAPPHIEFQVQTQMLVSGCACAVIGADIGEDSDIILIRPRHEGMIAAITERWAKLWTSVEANEPPEPDYVADSEFIIGRGQFVDVGSVIEADTLAGLKQIAVEYKRQSKAESAAEKAKKAAKAQIVSMIGGAEKVMDNGRVLISASMVGPCEVPAFVKNGSRNIRVYADVPDENTQEAV